MIHGLRYCKPVFASGFRYDAMLSGTPVAFVVPNSGTCLVSIARRGSPSSISSRWRS